MTDPAAFRSLLHRLQKDDESAETAYERLRFRLITFLRVRVPVEADAEAIADTALDRLARRLHEGTVVESVPQYALGIARLLVKEAEARIASERKRSAAFAYESTSGGRHEPFAPDGENTQEIMTALLACLDSLNRDARELVLTYYGRDGAARIASRHELAVSLGLAPNALRNRALRVRMRLEKCVSARLAQSSDHGGHGVMNPAKASLSIATGRERIR